MSTEHHPPDPSSPADHPPHGDAHVVDRLPSETGRNDSHRDLEDRVESHRDLETHRNLENRIERARLRVRVAALERSLAEQERRRRALVDQYETILEHRGRASLESYSSAVRDPPRDEGACTEADSTADTEGSPVPLQSIRSAVRSLFP